ncbi:lasso RiPP family leader peptide-containing protein [Jiangella rhizosphaerae]|uniref:Lasso RiPP family leader peptide-containing protein n=1 Tax=Jiangella rhizosphaerae TaxID=2293569 RepID=A0A418KNF8_9ACTN|nr:lasso RiPP family leader peptide-containing protein [Jiangella rhizosphaerae]
MAYQPPVLEEVGSVRELTLAHGGQGSSDQFLWFKWGNDRPPGGGGLS